MFGHRRIFWLAAMIGLLVVLANRSTAIVKAADSISPDEIRDAVLRGTAYLEREGFAWMKEQGCASCHHVPMMVWALNEARQRDYPINEKVLREVTSWALAAKNHDVAFQDLPLDKSLSETDYLGPLLMSLAVGASKDRDETVETERQRLLTHAISQQAKDGSWNANSGGRPPVHATQDVQASWVLLTLADAKAQHGTTDSWKAQREAATDWLSRNLPADSPQAIAMRLLVHERLGSRAEESKSLLESLLRLQNTDGGWSQTKDMQSDAFATGLALYALSRRDGADLNAAIGRAQAFLLKNQQVDGSWQMVSRPAEPPGPGPAKKLGPINYFGTAWATIGLIRSGPEGGVGRM